MSAIGNEPQGGELEAAAGAAVPEAAAPVAPEQPDIAGLMDGFKGTLDSFGQQLATIAERVPEPEPEIEPEPEAPVIQFSEEDFNDDGSLTLEAQTREIQRIAQGVVEETLRPQREAEAQARRDAGFDALEERYTDLQDEAKQEQLLELAQSRAAQIARSTGNPALVALATEPDFVETIYLAEQARQRAGDEVPAGSERGVTLERGGTAPPVAPSTPAPDDGDRIVALSKKSRYSLDD